MGVTATELTEAIDRLAVVDPADLADDELHDLVIAVQRATHRLTGVRARLVAPWDDRRLWAADASRSPAHRLAREATMSVRAAKTEVRRARALSAMPATTAAVAAGDLSADHVDLLAGANTDTRAAWFAEHEQMLVEQCRHLRYADAHRMVEYWKQGADSDTADDDAQRLHESRGLSASETLDGVVDVRGRLDPIGGAELLAELDRLSEQLRRDDLTGGVLRTATQRRADALVEMARRSRRATDNGLRPRPLLTVLLGSATFTNLCELSTGTVVTPSRLVGLLDDADIEAVVFDGAERPIKVSRKRRFTGALRRAIEVRDRHCQHPSGCDEPASRCDVDHITPHARGGHTSLDNGRLLCWPHNRHPNPDAGTGRSPPDEP